MEKLIKSLLVVLVILYTNGASATETPLLMDGKKTLYQRVLSTPDARLYESPEQTVSFNEILPFSVLYVYQKKQDWIKVGYGSFGDTAGWVQQAQTIIWNQALTVSFKDPQNTQRVMLFDSKDKLQTLVENYDTEAYQALYESAVKGDVGPDFPVIAIQPEAHIDIRQDFYLVPIKQHEDVYLGNEQARLLEIASVPLQDEPSSPTTIAARQNPRSYRSGIHFVIDSTSSMGPYIDRTREAVAKVYSAIEKQGLNNQVSFGLTAYRDNIDQVPELEYLVRPYVSLKQGTDVKQFFNHVNELSPSDVSSRDFREDAYAGIKSAIEDTDWNEFDARYVILITDAGPRESLDSLASTRLRPLALRQLAYATGVSLSFFPFRTTP